MKMYVVLIAVLLAACSPPEVYFTQPTAPMLGVPYPAPASDAPCECGYTHLYLLQQGVVQ